MTLPTSSFHHIGVHYLNAISNTCMRVTGNKYSAVSINKLHVICDVQVTWFEASAVKEMRPGALLGCYAAGNLRSVRNYHSTLSNKAEERKFVQLYNLLHRLMPSVKAPCCLRRSNKLYKNLIIMLVAIK